MNKNQYSYLHPLNCLITIYYINSVNEVININSLNTFINDIHENFKKYNNQIFNNLKLSIWDYRRDDISDIKNYAGLTWGWKNKIDLNSLQTGTDFDLAQILSHEVGHLVDWKTEENNPDDIIMPEWKKIRGIHSTPETNQVELMAEDIRLLFGCRGAKGYERGNYLQGNKIKGLHNMLLIWHFVYQFVKAIKSFNGTIRDVSHHYTNWNDFNYYGCMFHTFYNESQKYWYYCDRAGWQEYYPKYNIWKYIMKF